ncbi:MAG TPA: DUF932 domain-containing protein [Bacteroidales bacterium]|nr:DUF932 domain-containing protein [Bacteroidales bacterium]
MIVNNRLTVVKAGTLLQELRNIKNAQKDIPMSAAELAESVITGNLAMTDNGLSQYYGKLNIPKPFMSKLKNVDTKRAIVKEMAQEYDKKNKKLLVRVKENGKKYVRAVLSSMYSVIDNYDVVEAILKDENQDINIRGFINDDYSMKLEIALRNQINLSTENTPDNYIPMIVIENSETGNNTLNFRAGLWRLVCTNGMMRQIAIAEKATVKHIGQNTAMILASLRDMNIYQLEDKTHSMIEMIKNTKGVYVEKPKEAVEAILDGEPNKLIDRANYYLNNRYNGKTLFHAMNAATNMANELENHRRVALETKIYNNTLKMIK